MMKALKIFILLLSLGTSVMPVQAQSRNEYYTPWYCWLGVLYNNGHYKGTTGDRSVNLLYFDLKTIRIEEKGFLDFGAPVAGWLATRVFAPGDNLSFIEDQGEVSYIYLKLGFGLIDLDKLVLGAGVSGEVKGVNVDDIGESVIGFYGLSPLVYARADIGKVSVMPVLEFNVLYGTNKSDVTNKTVAKRNGFTLGTYVIIPVSDKLALNITPSYEAAKYKFKETGSTMTSGNFYLKLGLIKTL